MKIKGLDNIKKALKQVKNDTAQTTKDEIAATALNIERKATKAAPSVYKYDGGGEEQTDNEITQSIAAKKENEYHWTVTVNDKMAAYAEFGTGAFVEIEAGFEKIAMSYYVNGKGRMLPQPFFIPAYQEENEELIERLEDYIDELGL